MYILIKIKHFLISRKKPIIQIKTELIFKIIGIRATNPPTYLVSYMQCDN